MKCWIIYNAFLKSDKFIDYARMLQQAAEARGHEADIIKNANLLNILTTGITHDLVIQQKPDYVLFTDKDIYLARFLEAQGIPVYNSADVIEVSDDKIKTYQLLAKAGISIPKTIIVPKTFGLTARLDTEFFSKAISILKLPLIVKEAFGSFGEQVYLVESSSELQELVYHHGHKPLLIQEFIQTSYGRDLRIQVVGSETVAAMERQSANDFRSNITTGGSMSSYDPNLDERTTAIDASKAIGADYSGIDLLFGPDNKPIVCEVNANAHIRNLLECTGINVANDIIAYIEADKKRRTAW